MRRLVRVEMADGQDDELLRLARTGERFARQMHGADDVVLGGDDQKRRRRDAIDEAEGRVFGADRIQLRVKLHRTE